MKQVIFVMILSLVLVSGLSGVFSVNESPGEHVYNPSYNQCEAYTFVPTTATSIDISGLRIGATPTINSISIQSTGDFTVALELNNSYSNHKVYIDDKQLDFDQNNGDFIIFLAEDIRPGAHTIKGSCRNNQTAYLVQFSFQFIVSRDNYYYENSYAKIYPCSNGTSEFGAIRPVLFVEGFNVPGLMKGGTSFTYSIIEAWKTYLSDSKIYMLSLNTPSQDVRDNAMIVLGALRFIHNIFNSPLVEGTSVYGYSMGGILARYALAYAEQWNIPHYCTQYVSLDSPQRGASLNINMQNMMKSLKNVLNGYGQTNDTLNGALSALDTPAAKQLIRENRYADSYSYNMGSHQYRNLFAEINEEDNFIHELAGFPMSILNANSDSSYDGVVKPGFPYKQNNIKCFAYSNGGLELSGNINDESHAAAWSLDVLCFSYDGRAVKCEYDRQPGSVLEDFSRNESGSIYDFELSQYYAPIIVPTRSSLYLKRNSTSGGQPIPEFDININYLSSLANHSNILLDHTYFDQLVYAPNVPNIITEVESPVGGVISHKDEFNEWNWKHNERGGSVYAFDNWVTNNISLSANWLNQIENRSVCTIKGYISGNDFSDITGTMYINGFENRAFEIDQYGYYQIPYIYTKNASVRLLFEKPGYLSSIRDIYMTYSNVMLQDYTVSNVNMYTFNLNDIRVSSAGNGSFTTINAAIDFITDFVGSGLYYGDPIRIRVLPGTYESVDLSPLAGLNINNFTLEGVGEAVIQGGDYGIRLVIDDDAVCSGAVYNIIKMKITGSVRGIVFRDNLIVSSETPQAPNMTLHIYDCSVYNCGIEQFNNISNPDFSAAAIHFEGAGSIIKCNLSENAIRTYYSQYSQYCQAGGVFICNNSSSVTELRYNSFVNNVGGLSGGLVTKGVGQIQISDNEFTGNYYQYVGGVGMAFQANALSVYETSDITIQNNHFIQNIPESAPYGPVIGLSTLDVQSSLPIRFLNNTIINTTSSNDVAVGSLIFNISAGTGGQNIQIINNISSSGNINGCRIINDSGHNPLNFNNNVLHNTTLSGISANLYNPSDPNSVYNPTAPRFNYQCDPHLDANYIPIWNSSIMSPCIDNGYGSNDPDDTPPDIGANRAMDHKYWQYRFRSGENDRSDTYHWVCYPVVNSLTQGKTAAPVFFNELLGTSYVSSEVEVADVLQEILWRDTNGLGDISWDGSGWGQYHDTHNVVSPQGYKIKLKSSENSVLPTTTVELHHSGFLTPKNTPFTIYGSNSNGGQTYENWIGYFDTESAWPTDVFSSIWNDITMIKAKNWCLYRDPNSGHGAIIGTMYPINYGEMVIVSTLNDHEFRWNTTNPTDPIKKEKPQAFVFDEKADYTPVYLDLSAIEISDLKEIGLKLDGICKGAVVVTDSLEQICAYLDDGESLSSGMVELVFFYENKSQPPVMKRASINKNVIRRSSIGGNPDYPVYSLKITNEELTSTVVPVFSLDRNYPNPFNPTTTIRYSIDKPGQVSMDIYNVKGQLVKNLQSGYLDSGNHSIVWNGRDSSGNTCSSGVYFYKLRSNDRVLVRKMLMLK